MWSILIAIASTILGFGAGSAGLGNIMSSPKIPIPKYTSEACYQPQLDKVLTLNWPKDFTGVPDRRPELNPGVWGDKNLPASFNAASECRNLVMSDKATRNFILVRKNVRIPSCKVDELAGPFATGICHGWAENAPELTHRGTCSVDGYTDLRKVAQTVNEKGENLEIFWNPFSYNVGCNYAQDDNCGPGTRRNLNLKDFVYVVKQREAFDPDRFRANCPARWDAGATDGEACSHYFDVYMAQDLYEAIQTEEASSDPESQNYFIKQVLENCKESNTYYPAPEANLAIPPAFIKTPLYGQNQPVTETFGKIIYNTASEKANYLKYIWGRGDLYLPQRSNLLQGALEKPLPICPGGSFSKMSVFNLNLEADVIAPTIAPLVKCYDPLGKIYFLDDKNKTVNFMAYGQPASPERIFLVKDEEPDIAYAYAPTDKDYPDNTHNDPSLQLRKMQMLMQNVWTWATPWCKPAIYLYPKKAQSIGVKLDLDGKLTVSNPKYDSTAGWNVLALPDGTIKQPLNMTEYPYLYYEADLNNVNIPKEGWVVEKSNLKDQISKLLNQIGFNGKETDDFLSYWLPRLTEKPYYFITLLPENVINEKEKLTFSSTPDTLIRTRFVFEGLDYPMSVAPLPNIPSHSRTGFTVTDWGGTLVGKSCSDVSVK